MKFVWGRRLVLVSGQWSRAADKGKADIANSPRHVRL
jgi:hypothetical protein